MYLCSDALQYRLVDLKRLRNYINPAYKEGHRRHLLVTSPLVPLFSSSQRGFDPPLHVVGFFIFFLDGWISDDELCSNEVLGDASDEASDGEY
jgi:hypothetical protein